MVNGHNGRAFPRFYPRPTSQWYDTSATSNTSLPRPLIWSYSTYPSLRRAIFYQDRASSNSTSLLRLDQPDHGPIHLRDWCFRFARRRDSTTSSISGYEKLQKKTTGRARLLCTRPPKEGHQAREEIGRHKKTPPASASTGCQGLLRLYPARTSLEHRCTS